MAIRQNVNLMAGLNSRIKFSGETAPFVVPQTETAAVTPQATASFFNPILAEMAVSPQATPVIAPQLPIRPHLPISTLPFFPQLFQKTTTQIAQAALAALSSSNQAELQRAINTLTSRSVKAVNLMNYLERKVKIGEVLSQTAAQWQKDTQQDFAEAFQMPPEDFVAMDAIVSIAILNDPELEGELRDEHTAEPTQADLLENRRIVWQYPPPGTVLQPPYVVLLAVEHRDTQRAEESVQSILGSLVEHQGYKLPRTATQKLAGNVSAPIFNPAMLSSALNLKLNT
jgi:hypothetical protein